MGIYNSGIIKNAVHRRLQGFRSSVLSGGEKTTVSFRDELKSCMGGKTTAAKPVSAASGSGKTLSTNGSTLLYAMRNSDTDTTASAVLSTLGYLSGGKNTLRTAAEELSSSGAALRTALDSDNKETKTLALADFVADYNALAARLSASASTSAYLYRQSLSSYTKGSALEGSGITADGSGILTVTGEPDAEKLSRFIAGVTETARNISVYASTISDTDTSGISASSLYGSMPDLL